MKKLRKKIEIEVEKTETGFSAYVENLGVYTTGRNVPELHSKLLEALNLANAEKGFEVGSDNLILNLDLRQFFQHYKVLNANFLACRIGMNPSLLSQYVRGKKKPSAKQRERIIRGIHSIGRELSELNLV